MRTESGELDRLASDAVAIPLRTGAAELPGHVWMPSGEPRAVLVVHPATATPAGFYHRFARYAAGQGLAVVTYDYRGVGNTARAHRDLRMRDWLLEDAPSVTDFAAERFEGFRQVAVGHSLGGHALMLGAGGEHVDRFAIVASHLAAMHAIPDRRERMRVNALLHGVGPALGALLGYVPGKRLGIGEDIPAAAVREWAGWTRLPRYFLDDPTFDASDRMAATRARVLGVGVDDDPWSAPAAIDALLAAAGGPTERRQYSPAELGQQRVGHHGLFRAGPGERFWPELIAWLTAEG